MQADHGSRLSRNAFRLGVYAALISGSILFAVPFVWMISTSLKEDDEQMQKDLVWIPRLPPDCPASPYIDARGGMAFLKPDGVSAAAWEKLEPLIAPSLSPAIESLSNEQFGATPPDRARPLLLAALWRDISGMVPDTKLNTADFPAQLTHFASSEQIQKTRDRIFRAVDVGGVSLRALGDSDVLLRVNPGATGTADGTWTLAENKVPAELRPVQRKTNIDTEVRYTMNQPGDTVTLSTELQFVRTDSLKTFSLRLKGDASWNRLWAAIEVNGRRFEAKSSYPLFSKRYGEVFFQLPSADDDNDLLIHDWIPTQETSGNFNAPGRVRLSVWIENTSTWTKAYDKFTYNYRHALNYIPFWRYTLTSVFLVVINIFLSIFSSSLVAYAFARLNWPGRNYCWALLLATVMIPGQVTMIPSFLIFKWLGWFNTLRPLWVGHAFGSVFFIFMLREFMKGIPKDLEDSARIDGCNYWQIYWNVILPLVKPTLAAIGIFTFMGTWNEFMAPLMYLSDQRLYPLSLGLFAFQTVAGGNQGMIMAASLMMTLPVIALFFVAQRHFIQGITFTGIKG